METVSTRHLISAVLLSKSIPRMYLQSLYQNCCRRDKKHYSIKHHPEILYNPWHWSGYPGQRTPLSEGDPSMAWSISPSLSRASSGAANVRNSAIFSLETAGAEGIFTLFGFTGMPSLRIRKHKWGPVASPVDPTYPIVCPGFTLLPFFIPLANLDICR